MTDDQKDRGAGIAQPQEGVANEIATLLFAFWHHPAPSTRAQIECFIARHINGVTVQQLRACNLEAPSADLAAFQTLIAKWRQAAKVELSCGEMYPLGAAKGINWCADELEALLLGRRGAETEEP